MIQDLSDILFDHDETYGFDESNDSVMSYCEYVNVVVSADDRIVSAWFKGNVMTAFLQVVLFFCHCGKYRDVLDAYLGLLMDIMSEANSSADRLLRGIACECLSEILRVYPCLLSRRIEGLYQLVKQERTHVMGSYIDLFLGSLLNRLHVCFLIFTYWSIWIRMLILLMRGVGRIVLMLWRFWRILG